ncbi:MAG: tetratricopeptide repeat protein [Gemmatimonadetes bacterium]|nr:MAG: tetratricopeptide repeat protein [Gemmatimonadota bacterium]
MVKNKGYGFYCISFSEAAMEGKLVAASFHDFGKVLAMNFRPAYVIGVAAFLLYLQTLAPTITVGDSGELVTGAFLLETVHPPGYPLYTLIAHIFTWLPLGTVAFRVNLLSAVMGAICIALLFELLVRWFASKEIAAYTSLIFAFSQLMWLHAISTEVYSLSMLFIVLILYVALTYQQTGNRQWLYAIAIFHSLAITHHLTLIFLTPTLIYMVWRGWQKDRFPPVLTGLTLMGISGLFLTIFLYLPLRSAFRPDQFWGDLSQPANLLAHILGLKFGGFLFNQTFAQFLHRYQDAFWTLSAQLPFFLLIFSTIGIVVAVKKQAWDVFALVIFGLISLIFALNYNIPDIQPYYLPVILVGVVLAGYLLQLLWLSQLKFVAQVLGVTVLLSTVGINYPSKPQRQNFIAYDYTQNVFRSLPPDAVLVAHEAEPVFTAAYVQWVEQRRPDVTIRDGIIFNYEPEPEALYAQLPVSGRPLAAINDFILQRTLQMRAYPVGVVYLDVPNTMPFPQVIRPWGAPDSWDIETIVEAHRLSQGDRNLLARYLLMAGQPLWSDQPATAQKYYQQAAELAYDSKDILSVVGNVLVEHHHMEVGIKTLRAAVKLDPGDPYNLYHLGSAYLQDRIYPLAELYLRRAVKLHPTEAQFRNNLGNVYFYQQRYDLAIREYETVIQLLPTAATGYINLAQCYEQQGQLDHAADYYRQALQIDPYTPQREALQKKLQTLSSPQNEMDRLLSTGFAALQAGDRATAAQAFQAVLAQDSLQSQAHQGLAYLADLAGDYPAAIQHYEMALLDQQTNMELWGNLGVAYSHMGKNEQAIAVFKEALNINPRAHAVRNNLGIVYEKLGNYLQAKAEYERILEEDPDNVAAQQNLQLVREKLGSE